MKLRLEVEGTPLTATLDDTEAVRDFASMLPLTVKLEDYAATEKIAYLPQKLSTAGAPEGTSASAGDFAYYAPWGNLALFYRSSGYAKGLVKLGRFDAEVDVLRRPGELAATIELSEEEAG